MNVKRILTTIIGLPIVILFFIFANKYIMDIAFGIIAVIAMYEYRHCVSNKAKTIAWISYASVMSIALIHVIPSNILKNIQIICIPSLLMILFLHVIISDMKITLEEISYTLFGILYIFSFTVFLPIIYGISGYISGKILIWFVIISAWGTDIFAFIIGRKFGKTKFSKVSPNKSIEGCIAGSIGAVLLNMLFVLFLNKYGHYGLSYITTGVIALLLSIIGQVGDFSASVIKRYFNVKDFSELFPGHGGMIDRIDSVIFIAPFAYFLLTTFL